MRRGGASQISSPKDARRFVRASLLVPVTVALDFASRSLLSWPHNRIATSAANRTSTSRSGAQRAGTGESRRQRRDGMDLGAANRTPTTRGQ